MKRAKKRWAWKLTHQWPHFSHWWSRPPSSGTYHRLAQTQHQTQPRQALSRRQQGSGGLRVLVRRGKGQPADPVTKFHRVE